jgi:L-ascorbate metabolism protein UlaG (beta-lactamase superfamily)
MILLGIVLLCIFLAVYFFIHGKPFGASPSGQRLKKIQQSPLYRNGQFQNRSPTPSLTKGASFLGVLREFVFDRDKRNIPTSPLPSVKTDLLHLSPTEDILVWFGHSSYFMQVEGKTILVDPVFSGNASPLFFTTKSFAGSDIYTTEDLPMIDFLFISHDHWDHLDYKTVLKLIPKTRKIFTALGVAAHLERWGFESAIIQEMQWNDEMETEEGFRVNAISARHFSGRGFKRNGTLWTSFILRTAQKNIFIGGDSGYDVHFKEAGDKFGPFDLAILEDGQYNKNWKYIHMTPEETVQAAIDLRAKKLLPVHWAKFSLSLHAWDDPIIRIHREADRKKMPLLHPRIGEKVFLDQQQVFKNWWEEIH